MDLKKNFHFNKECPKAYNINKIASKTMLLVQINGNNEAQSVLQYKNITCIVAFYRGSSISI